MTIIHQLFQNSLDPVFGIDGNGNIRYWNEACEKLMGIPGEEAEGRKCYAVFSGMDLMGHIICTPDCNVLKSLKRGIPPRNHDMVVEGPDGDSILLNVGMFIHPVEEKRKTGIAAYKVLRRVDCYRFLQRMTAESRFKWRECSLKSFDLTPRELEVLELASNGFGTVEISDRLSISKVTVRNHFQNVFEKLDVHSRVEAVGLALRCNLF